MIVEQISLNSITLRPESGLESELLGKWAALEAAPKSVAGKSIPWLGDQAP